MLENLDVEIDTSTNIIPTLLPYRRILNMFLSFSLLRCKSFPECCGTLWLRAVAFLSLGHHSVPYHVVGFLGVSLLLPLLFDRSDLPTLDSLTNLYHFCLLD